MDETLNKYYDLVKAAHEAGSKRGCASTQVLLGSFESNGGNALQSVMAAACTFGGKHAPVLGTMQFFHQCVKEFEEKRSVEQLVRTFFEARQLIPGFGSSFVKGRLDPELKDCYEFLSQNYPKEYYILTEIANEVTTHKSIHPNLAIFTAILFRLMNVPAGFVWLELVKLRIQAWQDAMRQKFYEQIK